MSTHLIEKKPTSPFDQRAKALLHKEHLLAISRNDFLPPVSVKIELTNICNHDCYFCAYRKIVQEPKIKDLLKTERILEVIQELKRGGVKGIMFTGGGEPLLHPDADRIFTACRTLKLSYALITNGSRVSRLSDDALGGMRWIRFSINAGNSDQYADVHGVSPHDWRTVWQSVNRAADKSRFPNLAVGVSFVATYRNRLSLQELVLECKKTGVDYVHIRPAFIGPDTELERQLSKDEIAECVNSLERLKELESSTFKIYGITRRFLEIQNPPRDSIHCRTTPLISYILPTGDVSICTIVRGKDFNPKVADPFLGNIYQTDFFKMWNSEKHKKIIESLSSSGCSRCHFSEYNQVLQTVERDGFHEDFL